MTEWDHGHDGHDGADGVPELPDHDPGWEPYEDHLSEPTTTADPYGSPGHPGPEPHDAAPAEPAGLPEEQPADWSGPGDDLAHSGPGAWEPDGGLDPGDQADGTDPASWTAAAGADPFPAALDMDVQPGDGGPWVDPDLLGGPDHWTADGLGPAGPADPPDALLPDLAAADGDPDAGWDTLRDTDDPAVRALTLHWSP